MHCFVCQCCLSHSDNQDVRCLWNQNANDAFNGAMDLTHCPIVAADVLPLRGSCTTSCNEEVRVGIQGQQLWPSVKHNLLRARVAPEPQIFNKVDC
jgi:hypothetical protein